MRERSGGKGAVLKRVEIASYLHDASHVGLEEDVQEGLDQLKVRLPLQQRKERERESRKCKGKRNNRREKKATR